MNNFNYYTPTKVVFGENTENEIGRLIKEQKCQKVLIHYGGKSAIKSGLIDRVRASLNEENISYVDFSKYNKILFAIILHTFSLFFKSCFTSFRLLIKHNSIIL